MRLLLNVFLMSALVTIHSVSGADIWWKADPNSVPPVVTAAEIPWFELRVKDLDKAFPFYAQLFGWKCIDEGSDKLKACIILKADKQIGEVIEKPLDKDSKGSGNAVLIYLPVQDVRSTYQKAMGIGATSVYQPMNIPDGHKGSIAVIKDLEGIPIGLFSDRPL